uniref:Ovule protein n=1 Tax=Mesocestoides corti TaxID=53468 RepID=A0A5K3G1J1_MESCO
PPPSQPAACQSASQPRPIHRSPVQKLLLDAVHFNSISPPSLVINAPAFSSRGLLSCSLFPSHLATVNAPGCVTSVSSSNKTTPPASKNFTTNSANFSEGFKILFSRTKASLVWPLPP